ncbi:MAG: beta-lactamase family protein [Propionibacteriaceae bacterium]|jgi:CubicO group peptidase (beta-lactamase class C family)|nr:beta-lactamase family protein [Propionibacteriaceae bacterium]
MRWNEVRRLADGHSAVYSLLVLHGDERVLEIRRGCAPEAVFYTFSVTKPITALAVHLLAARGRLDLDAPIAEVWPAYACHGKEAITPRHVLTHQAGVPLSTGHLTADMAAMPFNRLSTQLAERARPVSPPGAVTDYHVLSFGFILGEIVRRVDGRTIDQFVVEEFFAPLGLSNTALSLTPLLETGSHPVRLTAPDPSQRRVALTLNQIPTRRAVVPAASLQTTARDLATFYRMLLRSGVDLSGRQIVPVEAIAAARTPAPRAALDTTIGERPRFATGFQLGGHGGLSHATTFGHNGSNVCTVWADPELDLTFVYLSPLYAPDEQSWLFLNDLSDEVLHRFM